MDPTAKGIELLRECIGSILEGLLAEKKKPGGPRTDAGALRQLNPGKFKLHVRGSVKAAKGDVKKAAKSMGVAKRTLYHYLSDEPGLSKVKTKADLEVSRGE